MEAKQVMDALEQRALQAVELAKRLGADQAEAGASHDEGLNVTVRLGQVESVERQKDRGLAVTVYKNGSKGNASTSDFSAKGVEDAVHKAISIAGFTTADPYAGLAEAQLMAQDPPDLDLYHPWDLDVDSASALALRAENAARGVDSRIDNSEGATTSTGGGFRIYANSHGFVGAYGTTNHSISCSVVAKQDGLLERDYWYSVSRLADQLMMPEEVGERAAQRALQRLGARQLSTRVVPVIFPPEIARGLFGHFVAAIRGTSQYRRASFLLDVAGRKIFPDFVNIAEEPHLPQAMASAPFDGEGVTTRRRSLVTDGVVQGYVLSSYSARRLGLQTTGNAGGIHNLLVTATAGSLETLIAGSDKAFVITELLGQGVNTVTGDYSRGAAGFWVEGGEIAYPVSEVTVAGNLSSMFENIVAIGSDIDVRGAIRCGSVLIEGMTVAGE
jgi:PmbA protein